MQMPRLLLCCFLVSGAGCSSSTTAQTNVDAGTGGLGGTSGDRDAAGGSAGSSSGAGGTAGAGGACSPMTPLVDLRSPGNEQLEQFLESGVSITGSSTLLRSGGNTTRPDGLGVVGGANDWAIDSGESVTIRFTRSAATGVTYYLSASLDLDMDGVPGEATVTAYDATGNALDTVTTTGAGYKRVSELLGGVPISKFSIEAGTDGVVLGNLTFTACIE